MPSNIAKRVEALREQIKREAGWLKQGWDAYVDGWRTRAEAWAAEVEGRTVYLSDDGYEYLEWPKIDLHLTVGPDEGLDSASGLVAGLTCRGSMDIDSGTRVLEYLDPEAPMPPCAFGYHLHLFVTPHENATGAGCRKQLVEVQLEQIPASTKETRIYKIVCPGEDALLGVSTEAARAE